MCSHPRTSEIQGEVLIFFNLEKKPQGKGEFPQKIGECKALSIRKGLKFSRGGGNPFPPKIY